MAWNLREIVVNKQSSDNSNHPFLTLPLLRGGKGWGNHCPLLTDLNRTASMTITAAPDDS